MSEFEGSMDQRRAYLAAQIARQRGELADAYRNLEAPLRYTDYGLRGFGFLRQNPWILTAVPAVFSIASTLIGLRKGKPKPSQRQGLEKRAKKGIAKHVATWGGRGWKLYQLYRRVRTYLP